MGIVATCSSNLDSNHWAPLTTLSIAGPKGTTYSVTGIGNPVIQAMDDKSRGFVCRSDFGMLFYRKDAVDDVREGLSRALDKSESAALIPEKYWVPHWTPPVAAEVKRYEDHPPAAASNEEVASDQWLIARGALRPETIAMIRYRMNDSVETSEIFRRSAKANSYYVRADVKILHQISNIFFDVANAAEGEGVDVDEEAIKFMGLRFSGMKKDLEDYERNTSWTHGMTGTIVAFGLGVPVVTGGLILGWGWAKKKWFDKDDDNTKPPSPPLGGVIYHVTVESGATVILGENTQLVGAVPDTEAEPATPPAASSYVVNSAHGALTLETMACEAGRALGDKIQYVANGVADAAIYDLNLVSAQTAATGAFLVMAVGAVMSARMGNFGPMQRLIPILKF